MLFIGRKATVEIMFDVYPPWMSLTGRKLPLKIIENVVIIILLSVEQAIDAVLFPFSAKVLLHPGTYLEGVWSKLMTRDGGIWFSLYFLAIEYKFNSSISFFNSFNIDILPVLDRCLLNPMSPTFLNDTT